MPVVYIRGYPQPAIDSLSRTFAAAGSASVSLTINGTGLGTADLGLSVYKGVTSVNVTRADTQGSGIPASLTPMPYVPGETPPVGTSVEAILNTEGAAPGTYNISVTAFGHTTNSLQFTLSDRQPVIDWIDQEPLSANSQANIVIHGHNFGPAPGGSIAVCSPAAEPCQSVANSITAEKTFWSDEEIHARLTAGPTASGYYDVQITSMGASGTGFQPAPGGQTTAKSTRGRIVASNDPNLTLRVTSNDNEISPGAVVYIDQTPRMPVLSAQIVALNSQPINGTATWQFKLYQDCPNCSPYVLYQWTTEWPGSPIQQAANVIWNISSLIQNDVRGGEASIEWQYNGVAQQAFRFTIRATNPSVVAIEAELAAQNAPWFLKNIFIHETKASQFCESGRMDILYCKPSNLNWGMPVFGYPGGYGLGQIDPPQGLDAIWNWKANISAAISLTNNKITVGHAWWREQVRQWDIYNAAAPARGLATVPFPDDDVNPQDIIPQCRFKFAREPITGQIGTYWFGDAVAMKAYAGASRGNYISWIGTGDAHWQINRPNTVEANVVGEFCTCDTLQSCRTDLQ